YPTYRQVIENPISMRNIRQLINRGPEKGFATLSQYSDAWYTMFANAKLFNEPDSQIYRDAEELEAF
ncbi:hypothetical protein K435DRAFT_637089, partial [Dendrothele bispora CBS 962.96]